jgi:hypothetical protein
MGTKNDLKFRQSLTSMILQDQFHLQIIKMFFYVTCTRMVSAQKEIDQVYFPKFCKYKQTVAWKDFIL